MLEKSTNSWFVKGTGKKHPSGVSTYYFYCNRSGLFKSNSTGQRTIKSQGSSKINSHCTAGIQVQVLGTGDLNVTVVKTHYGHTQSLGHLRISDTVRKEIAAQLATGVSMDKILDNVRESITDHTERIHLLTKKDLYNIEKSFNVRKEQRHNDDATSVRIWVEEMRQREDNPVLLYKPQGQLEPLVGTCKGLSIDDIILVIQTPIQADMFLKCANQSAVCVDATHGTNAYDFQLISILVVDELGEGFPVGWCFSNKEDQATLGNFFATVKANTGLVDPKWFMSDDAQQYYSAWVKCFSPTPQKLLCSWHVDRAWRKALAKIPNKEDQVNTYHILRILLEEVSVPRFEELLNKAVQSWKTDLSTKDFYNYFTSNYLNRKQEWAACFRKGSTVNTNMFVEAFHRVLKHVYLKGVANKRMDHCIITLMKLARDKIYERLIKIEKGKSTGRLQAIHKRHTTSLTLSTELIEPNPSTSNQWIVKSSHTDDSYQVTEQAKKCPHNCSLRCRYCSVCIHEYTCTCLDSLIHATICKHIHLLRRFLNKIQTEPQPLTITS